MKRLELTDEEFDALDDFICRYVLSDRRVIKDEDPNLTSVFDKVVNKSMRILEYAEK